MLIYGIGELIVFANNMTLQFKIEDTVKVKSDVFEDDFNINLCNRVGRVAGWETEDLEEPLYYVYWDSITLNELDIILHEEEGIDWDFTVLYERTLKSFNFKVL